eukprot:scaffold162035_cov18-Tisochrysis_lutea.AAC.1
MLCFPGRPLTKVHMGTVDLTNGATGPSPNSLDLPHSSILGSIPPIQAQPWYLLAFPSCMRPFGLHRPSFSSFVDGNACWSWLCAANAALIVVGNTCCLIVSCGPSPLAWSPTTMPAALDCVLQTQPYSLVTNPNALGNASWDETLL